jgi:superfamily II DNA or RNA helicase
VELRPYQRECLEQLLRSYKAGKRRLLVSLPTGTGKTVVFAQFPSFFQVKKRMLVLAHREELLEQAAEKLRRANPGISVGVEQAQRRAGEAQVVVASVATLRGARLQALDPEQFYLVVVDEAHHAVAATYRRILEHLGAFAPETRKLVVGFTATPRRGDGGSLGEVFEEVTFARGLEPMIASGFLSPVVGWRVHTGLSLDGVKVQRGDFVEAQLARAVNLPARNRLVARAYAEHAPGRRAVVFAADVAHAQDLAVAFREQGVRSEAVWGAMGREARLAALRRFRAGETPVLTNCNLLTEGFDEPEVACVILARPTQSLLLYTQMVGRGTRLAPGKADLVVVDVADNSRKHSLATLNLLFDLPEGLELRGAPAVDVAQSVRGLSGQMPWIDLGRLREADEIPFASERIDLFRVEPPDEIAPATDLAWLASPSGGYRLALPERRQAQLGATLLGGWELELPGERHPLAARGPAEAVREADVLVRSRYPEFVRVLDRHARWRDGLATEKQLQTLARLGLPRPKGLTKGMASHMIGLSLGAGRG